MLIFVTTSYYITATGGTKLREDIQNRANILKLLNFGELKLFESAQGQHNLITFLEKKSLPITPANTVDSPFKGGNTPAEFFSLSREVPQSGGGLCSATTIVVNKKGHLTQAMMNTILSGADPDTKIYTIPQLDLWANGNLKLTNGGVDEILDKMLTNSKLLSEICEVNQGILSGADTLTDKHISKFGGIGSKGDGIFVLDLQNPSDKTLFESIPLNEKDILKPFYKNSDIVKYSVDKKATKYIIYITKKTQIANYPIILKHLEKFKTILQEKRETKTGQIPWYSLHWARNQSIFESEKIVCSRRAKNNVFGFENNKMYEQSDITIIPNYKLKAGYSLKFLLGVLNSKLIYKWLYNRGKRKGEMLELYQEPLSKIPIPILDTNHKQDLAQKIQVLVEEILRIKNEELGITTDLETQIDALVYVLYGLSQEEIEVITKN